MLSEYQSFLVCVLYKEKNIKDINLCLPEMYITNVQKQES